MVEVGKHRGGFAELVGDLTACRAGIAFDTLAQQFRRQIAAFGQPGQAATAFGVEQQIEQHRQALEIPHLARAHLTQRFAHQLTVEHQDGATVLFFDHGVAEGRTVDFFVGVTLSAGIDDQPAGPGQWRIDETPRADLVHPRHAATGALAQGDAAAIAAGGAQGQPGQVLRRVLAHQVAIEDKTAAAQ
ncbi:hypothetical protein D3C72_1423810 [compost metagenome]